VLASEARYISNNQLIVLFLKITRFDQILNIIKSTNKNKNRLRVHCNLNALEAGNKGGLHLRLTASLPSVNRLSTKCVGPRCLTTLWPSMVSYRESVTFYLVVYIVYVIKCIIMSKIEIC
jgi:hypothetical protein